jgi:hypothetical protein
METENTMGERALYDGRCQRQSDSGEFVYAVRRDKTCTATEIWRMAADGTNKHRVKTYLGISGAIGWIPGRETILIGRFHPKSTLNSATGQESFLEFPKGLELFSTAISPNGRFLAGAGRIIRSIAADDREDDGMFIYDIVTGEIQKILSGYYGSPAWSPDEKKLAIVVGTSSYSPAEESRINIVDLDTGECIDTEINGYAPVFSPDGGRLAYFTASTEPPDTSAFVADLKTGRRWAVSALDNSARYPAWSPDGTRILFSKWQREPRHTIVSSLHVAAADGSGEKEIFSKQMRMAIQWCSWAPAGDAVYAHALIPLEDTSMPSCSDVTEVETRSSILKIAVDGSGIISDLGGNEDDSLLSPEEAQQMACAKDRIDAGRAMSGRAYELRKEGDFIQSSMKLKEVASIFAGIAQKYPLSALSAGDLRRESERMESEAARTPEEILDDECRQNIAAVRRCMYSYLGTYDKLPDSMETLRDSICAIMKKDGTYEGPRTPEKDAEFTRTFYCPGVHKREQVLFNFDAQGKTRLSPDDILISCPNHPNKKINPDKWLIEKMNEH